MYLTIEILLIGTFMQYFRYSTMHSSLALVIGFIGMTAYAELEQLRAGDRSPELMASFAQNQKDLGYGLLLKKYAPNVTDATETHIQSAVKDTIPHVPSLFWSFRAMVASGFLMLLLFAGLNRDLIIKLYLQQGIMDLWV